MGYSRRSMPRISAPICLVSGTISNDPLVAFGFTATFISFLPRGLWRRQSTPPIAMDFSNGKARRSDARLTAHASLGSDWHLRGDVRRLAARKRGQDAIDQSARRLRAQFDGHAVAAALAFISEVDGEHVIERRVERVIEINVRSVDFHPALAAFGAADEGRFFNNVGAHGGLRYSAATLEADVARLRLKNSNTLRQPSIA